jgi:aminoglycoside 3-N-acetyltransferase
MYSKNDLIDAFIRLGIRREDTLLVHSSMKAIGEVEGRAETVLDAFIEYMEPGLLIFPTHSWDTIGGDRLVFDPEKEPSCVGILSNLFMKREGVVRSLHPTHSVAALGKEAISFVEGEEHIDTPCGLNGCWHKLYKRAAKILFLGCTLKRNTIIHGVEEWVGIENRLTKHHVPMKIIMPDKSIMDRPMRRHSSPVRDISFFYDKLEKPLLYKGLAKKGKIGDADSILCDSKGMVNLTADFLKRNHDLFLDDQPVPDEWYRTDTK